ncbi:hypothetical protein ON010_g19048 [Phytophthora cinnamomi]|nr:hypothetical protein ON010_g19048 [Phytophthora cinnamomi]
MSGAVFDRCIARNVRYLLPENFHQRLEAVLDRGHVLDPHEVLGAVVRVDEQSSEKQERKNNDHANDGGDVDSANQAGHHESQTNRCSDRRNGAEEEDD